MTEKYDFKENNGKPTWFNHLLLQSDVKKLTASESFDSSDMTVRLEINGIEVRISDFNEVLSDWSDRMESQIKEKLEYLSKEKTVKENAEILLKEKLGNCYEVLQAIEDSAWKLEIDLK